MFKFCQKLIGQKLIKKNNIGQNWPKIGQKVFKNLLKKT
jgi:hypothetical protein